MSNIGKILMNQLHRYVVDGVPNHLQVILIISEPDSDGTTNFASTADKEDTITILEDLIDRMRNNQIHDTPTEN